MTSTISSGLEKVRENISAPFADAKAKDLQKDIKDVHDPSNRITTDYGVKVSNTDDWLKVATEDKTG